MSSSQKLILAFVALILGAVLIGVIATQSLDVTAVNNVYNESHNLDSCVAYNASSDTGYDVNESNSACNVTVSNNPTGWKTNDCPLTSVTINNGTSGELTSGTDYTLYASTGLVQMLDSATTKNLSGNDTFAYYSYCGDDYLNSSWGRSVLNLVGGFFAIALLLLSVGLFFDIAKDYGII